MPESAAEEMQDEYAEYKAFFTPAEVKEETQRMFRYKGTIRISSAGVLLDGYRNYAGGFQMIAAVVGLCAVFAATRNREYGVLLGLLAALLTLVASVVYPLLHRVVGALFGNRIRSARYVSFEGVKAFYDVKHKVIALNRDEGEDSWMLVRVELAWPSSFPKVLDEFRKVLGERLRPAVMDRMEPGRKKFLVVTLSLVAAAGLTTALLRYLDVLG